MSEEKDHAEMSYRELQEEAGIRGIKSFGLKKDQLIEKLSGKAQGTGDLPAGSVKSDPGASGEATKRPTMRQYVSLKYSSLRLPIKSAYFKYYEGGNAQLVNGEAIQFTDGSYQTDNPAEIEFLDNHPNNKAVGKGSAEFVSLVKQASMDELKTEFAKATKTLEQTRIENERLAQENAELRMRAAGQVLPVAKAETQTGIRGTADIVQAKF